MDAVQHVPNRICRHAKGFSLISLVIGLGVGMLAIELGIQCLGIGHRQWVATEKSLSADRNSRTLFLSLKQDLHACGYRGLRYNDAHYAVEESMDIPTITAVHGMTAPNVSQEFNPAWRSRLLPGSDILIISDIPIAHWALERQGPSVLQLKENGRHGVGVDHIKAEQRALIADAQGAAWLRVAAVDEVQKRITAHEKIHRIYGKEAIFTPVERVSYFVARSARDLKHRYALWRRVEGRNAEELLQGIKAFNLQYNVLDSGVCALGKYFSAASITDWSLICRVRVIWVDEMRSQSYSAEIGVGRGTW